MVKKEGIGEVVLDSSLALDPEFCQLKELYKKVKEKHALQSAAFFQKLEEQEILIPVTIFTKELSGLEAICTYLRDHLHLSNKNIAHLLNRSEKTTWQAYHSGKKKALAPNVASPTMYMIQVSDIRSRKLSVLETIVKHLKETFHLSYHAIAQLLMRDDRTIWTVYHRALKKNNG